VQKLSCPQVQESELLLVQVQELVQQAQRHLLQLFSLK
jgi:hypothetical protein